MRLKFQVDRSPHLEASVCYRCTVYVLQHINGISAASKDSAKQRTTNSGWKTPNGVVMASKPTCGPEQFPRRPITHEVTH
jgi:hypothetical protein